MKSTNNHTLFSNIKIRFKVVALIILLSSLILFSSCKKFIEVENPVDQIVVEKVFSDDQTATSAINGLYVQAMRFSFRFLNGGITIFSGLSSDELYNTFTANLSDIEFKDNSLSPSNTNLETRFWTTPYQQIYQANAIIEGLNKSTKVSFSVKQQLLGEAKFMRALYYFHLVNLFGDVPLILTTDYTVNAIMPRIPISQVYEQIITDLTDAERRLTVNYPSTNRIRPNKLCATALLARVYLYQKNWIAAEAKASSVIGSGQYTLLVNLNNVFLSNSNEVIFQLIPNSTFNSTTEGQAYVPTTSASSLPTYSLTSYVANSFEVGDQRKSSWTASKLYLGNTYNYSFKYKVRSSTTPPTEHNVLFRLAELYLIRAEARAELSNLTGAQSDINIIRSRAGLSALNSNDKSFLLAAVRKERQCELFTEGHRWYDLKRTDSANAVLSVRKAPNWQNTDALYPIPANQLRLNIFLVQNPGY